MVRGLFTAYNGMTNEQDRLDIISNNLANAATVGYKEESSTSQSFDQLLTLKVKDASEMFNNRPIGKMSLGVKLGEVYTKFDQGSMRQTSGTCDLALEGKGFFNIQVTNKAGVVSTEYTRNGSFTMTKDGYIVDSDGNHVMGEDGRLQVPVNAAEIIIDTSGAIYADGEYIDSLKITDFEDYDYLTKVAGTRYRALEGATAVDGTALVRQGFLEQSNVNVVSEMVEMIAITRAYEANQKMIKSIDSTLELVANSVGKV